MLTRTTKTYAIGERHWVLVDARDMVVGRLAALLATRLRGKHRPQYSPHTDCGDMVVVVNAAHVCFTGNKRGGKQYHRHTGWPGGLRTTTPERILEGKRPEEVLRLAVQRMLPRTRLGRSQMRNLKVYAEGEHPHDGQTPELIDMAGLSPKNVSRREV